MKPVRAFGLACLLSGFALAAFSAPPPPPASTGQGPCVHDIQTICQGVQRGNGAIRTCMKQNWKKFSPACKAAIKARRAQKAAATAPPPPGA